MSNKQPTYLNYAAISELREQLEIKEQQLNDIKTDFKLIAKTLIKISPQHKAWVQTRFERYL